MKPLSNMQMDGGLIAYGKFGWDGFVYLLFILFHNIMALFTRDFRQSFTNYVWQKHKK
jgi:hypothetical protein